MKLQKKIKKKGTKKEPYFGKVAHKAIVDYQNSDCTKEKHAIYEKTIKRSFEKLAENLIYIYGFSRDPEHFKVLKLDCVSFLYETLEKFDSERGSKAFSYFNVCAKNHLLMKSKKATKAKIRNVSLQDLAELNSAEKDMVEKYKMIPAQDSLMIREEDKELLKEVLGKIKSRVNNENEKLCIDSVITLFQNIDDLDFLNKRAVFVYLREISGLNPKQLSVSLSSIRKHYRDIVKSDDMFLLFG